MTYPEVLGGRPRLNSVDMSRWGGELTVAESEALWGLGVRNIKVGDGWSGPGGSGEWARQQAETWLAVTSERGGTVDAYIYLYMAADPIQQVANAFLTLAGIPVRMWWLDAEDTLSPALSASDRESFLSTAAEEVTRRDGTRPGIYTGRWWWIPNMNNSTLFSDLPLWNSYYDQDPDTDGLPYGGWTDSAVEQYDDTQYLGGQSVDLNYDKTLEEEMADPRVDEIMMALTGDATDSRGVMARWNRRDGAATGNSLLDGYVLQQDSINAIVAQLTASGAIVAGMTAEEVRAIVVAALTGAHIVP